MLLNALREQVLEANLELERRGLILYTFGNVSGISREDGLVVIKPSGVPYERMTSSDMVVADLDGSVAREHCVLPLGPSNAPRAIQGVSRYRRRRPYSLGVRHGVGSGLKTHSLPRHDTRGLLLRPHSGDR